MKLPLLSASLLLAALSVLAQGPAGYDVPPDASGPHGFTAGRTGFGHMHQPVINAPW